MEEKLHECPQCGDSVGFSKQLTTFQTQRSEEQAAKTGEITEEFIKSSRVDLEMQKKELNHKR